MYYSRSVTGAVVIGTITMIYQYVESASRTFYNVTWQYSELVQQAANITTVEPLITSYRNL